MHCTLTRADGAAIHTNLTLTPGRYSANALGGPDAATVVVSGDKNTLSDVLTWLACRVVIHNDAGLPVWWGLVQAAALSTWSEALQAFAPNLVIVTLGTNDHAQDYTIANFTTYMDVIVDAIQAAMPLCDILIATPGDNGNTATYTIEEYVDALRDIAIAQVTAGFDMLLALGDYYASGTGRSLWEDASHINATAGRIVDGLLYEQLLRLP